jgi:hypothetical protein
MRSDVSRDVTYQAALRAILAMENVMGQVIPWPGPERRSGKPVRETDGPTGRILLFLGVRYERHEDDSGVKLAAVIRGAPNERPPRRRKRG